MKYASLGCGQGTALARVFARKNIEAASCTAFLFAHAFARATLLRYGDDDRSVRARTYQGSGNGPPNNSPTTSSTIAGVRSRSSP
jgi:hypothetical protein